MPFLKRDELCRKILECFCQKIETNISTALLFLLIWNKQLYCYHIWPNLSAKLVKLLRKKTENAIKNYKKLSIVHNKLHIIRWTCFVLIPLTTLYDEYIDCSKLIEQKTIWAYSSYPNKIGRNHNLKLIEISVLCSLAIICGHCWYKKKGEKVV